MATIEEKVLEQGAGRRSLEQMFEERDRLTRESGHYYGITELSLRDADPLKFERFYSRLHTCVLAAREVARYVAASPGGREMGESLWALTTAEGDSLALSLGFFSHTAAFPVAVRYMATEKYDDNPGIDDADVFCTDDGLTGGAPHPGDTYCYVPIVVQGEIIAWAVGLNHIMEAGAPVAGSWPGFCVDTFMDGFVFPPMKTGTKLKQATWWDNLWKRRTRAGTMNILDDKMRLAGCAMVHKGVHEIVHEFGLPYFKRAVREVIEESRRMVMDNIKALMIPGTYTGVAFRVAKYGDMQKIWAQADRDNLIHIRQELSVDGKGRMAADLEGSSRWGQHAFNGYPGGADCSLYLAMTNTFSHNTKVTAGINLTVTSHYPKGCIYNPDNDFASFANIWAQSMAMNSVGFYSINRALFSRGYLEEAFATDGDWDGVQGAGELADGTPYGFTNFEYVGGVASGAFCYRDGEPVTWAEWTQLCNIGNAEEFEYLIPTMFYLGRKTLPGFCGHGKFRGGLGQTSVHWIVDPGRHLGMSRGGAGTAMTTFTATGMSGGYPAPNCFHVTARGTNLQELIDNGGHTPRDAMEVIEYAADGRLKVDKLEVWKYDPPELQMKHNDLWSNATGAAGGWGDPIERPASLALQDLNEGSMKPAFVAALYGVIATQNAAGEWELDAPATAARRAAIRLARKDAKPAAQWWQEERERVVRREFITPIADMYRGSASFPKFDREFRGFWQLPADFQI
ncbi:MAG: hydantoinase B/oxoprolinase family protein [Gammaproteobacteria bacterium]|nr:hydantoinase B/oxoprolinase family protein [Gammaproteobacteria bacterium]